MTTGVRARATRAAIGFAVFVAFVLALSLGPSRQVSRGRREVTVSLVASHGIAQLFVPSRELRSSAPVKLSAAHARGFDSAFALGPALPRLSGPLTVAPAELSAVAPPSRAPAVVLPNPRTTPKSSRAPPTLA